MLRMMHPVKGYKLAAKDGEFGRVKDFLFDEEHWTVRCLVADTGRWLPGKKVLISPVSLGRPDWMSKTLQVNLTKEEIKDQPDLDDAAPVSRRHERLWFERYGYPYYLGGAYAWGVGEDPLSLCAMDAAGAEAEPLSPENDEGYLRSFEEVRSYGVSGPDEELGTISDCIFDEVTWRIRYLVVDLSTWRSGRLILLATDWVDRISWEEQTVQTEFSRNMVRAAPEFVPELPVSRDYEDELYNYYGKPVYWDDRIEVSS